MANLFIKPNTKKKQYGNVVHLSAIEPPVWLALYAGQFQDSCLIDMEAENIDTEGLLSRLKDIDVDKVVIFATGSHPSAHIQQAEAAETLKAVLNTVPAPSVEVHSHLPFNPINSGPLNLSLLPVNKYRAHNWHAWGREDKSYGATFSSISCPFSCDFCCVKSFYKSAYAQRISRLVVKDIKAFLAKGVTNFKMMDELFVVNNKGVHAVCDLIAQEGLGKDINIWAYARIDTVTEELLKKLRNAGIRWLAYGIESGNEQIRNGVMKGKFTNDKIRDIVKMTKDADINVVGNYMFGFWEDSLETMRETLDFALELNCEYANFYCTTAYPGSKFYEEMKMKGIDLPRRGEEFAQMSPSFKPIPTAKVEAKSVLEFRDNAFKEYFNDSGYLSMMSKRFGEKVRDDIQDMLGVEMRCV